MDQSELIERLTKASGSSEMAQLTSFRAYRKNRFGETKEITIDVYDGGPGAASFRYHIVAQDDAGRKATGNPAADLNTVIATVHWGGLDKDIKS